MVLLLSQAKPLFPFSRLASCGALPCSLMICHPLSYIVLLTVFLREERPAGVMGRDGEGRGRSRMDEGEEEFVPNPRRRKTSRGAAVSAKLAAIRSKYYHELQLLLREFTRLEHELAPRAEASGDEAERVRLARLQYFVHHIKSTMDRMDDAKAGRYQYTMSLLDVLHEHITTRILPVKERLIGQMEAMGATLSEAPASEQAASASSAAAGDAPPVPTNAGGAAITAPTGLEGGAAAAKAAGIATSASPTGEALAIAPSDDGDRTTEEEDTDTELAMLGGLDFGVEEDATVEDLFTPMAPIEPLELLKQVTESTGDTHDAGQRSDEGEAEGLGLGLDGSFGLVASAASASASGGASGAAKNASTSAAEQVMPLPLPLPLEPTPPPTQQQLQAQVHLSIVRPTSIAAKRKLEIPKRRSHKRQRSLVPILRQPRDVFYECALCKESYTQQIRCNPWWALFQQECPKCNRMQIPRVNICNPINNVDYLTGILSQASTDGDGHGGGHIAGCESGDSYDSDSDSDEEGADKESCLNHEQAAKLLILMCHSRSCPGHHSDPRNEEVCRSTKFLMLHIRDCLGRLPNGQPCPYSWCRPCKALLHHLVHCSTPKECHVCNPVDLPLPLQELRAQNLLEERNIQCVPASAAPAVPRQHLYQPTITGRG
ncbi:unnamed protein product [Chrysoparadoxa australica]